MSDSVLREQLLTLLEGGKAHVNFQAAITNFPLEYINSRAAGIPYSSWDLIEHMRIAQYDILDFIKNPDYEELKWPDDYWPPKEEGATSEMWNTTIMKFRDDLDALKKIIKDPQTDFTSPIPHAPKYTVLREILLVADHNAYHTGQLITLRRALQIY